MGPGGLWRGGERVRATRAAANGWAQRWQVGQAEWRATRTTARSRPRRGAGWRAGGGGVLGREVTRAAWAGLGCWFQGSVGLGFGFIFLSISISISTPLSLFLIQTGFEFKFKFEFEPHSNKNMHQHECNTNF